MIAGPPHHPNLGACSDELRRPVPTWEVVQGVSADHQDHLAAGILRA